MSMFGSCPHCAMDWADRNVPVAGSLLVGIYSRELDRTVEFMCPGCGTRFPRGEVTP